MRAAFLLVALLAAGCVTRTRADGPAAPVEAPADGLVVQCERARIVVPDGETIALGEDGSFTRGPVTVRTPGLSMEIGGADFSVVAEGEVRIHRTEGGRTFSEGPYRLAVYRNGQLLTR